MNRDEVLDLLREHKATLAQRFGVAELTLFGSIARDQAKDNSDVDILVRLSATLRNMEQIGEAATHVPDEIRKEYREIQWRSIVATRNRLAHGYLGIDMSTGFLYPGILL